MDFELKAVPPPQSRLFKSGGASVHIRATWSRCLM